MSEEIYEGTPLEGYLKETDTAEDWGIESNIGIESSSDEGANLSDTQRENGTNTYDFKNHENKHRKFPGPNKQQIPLLLGRGRSYTEEERFRQSLRSLLCQKVSYEESTRFLDQFHYIIISSSLLEPRPLLTAWSEPSDARRRRLLFDQKKPWTNLYVEPVFRVTGGSGIVTLCVLLHCKYRQSSSSGERSTVAIIITIAVIIYYFATSRRRLLRSLRRKTLYNMEMFTQSAKLFDGDCVRALKSLQEMDVVANGFGAHGQPNFLMRNVITGRKRRVAVASSLHLLTEVYLDAFRDCVCMGERSSLDQFLNIYDLKDKMVELNFEMSDKFVGFTDTYRFPYESAQACFVTVSELKRELRKVHLLRRALLCCFLAATSTGKATVTELESWTTICDHLINANNLTEQLSNIIAHERADQDNEEQPIPGKRHSPTFIDALASVKHLAARMEVVIDSELSPEDKEHHVSVIEDEISSLSRKWKKFMDQRERNEAKQERQHNESDYGPRHHNFDRTVSSPTLVMTPETSEISTFSVPDLTDVTGDEGTFDSFQQQSSVLEGETPLFILPRSNLTREERIKIAQKEREMTKETAPSLSQKNSLILELNSVLKKKH